MRAAGSINRAAAPTQPCTARYTTRCGLQHKAAARTAKAAPATAPATAEAEAQQIRFWFKFARAHSRDVTILIWPEKSPGVFCARDCDALFPPPTSTPTPTRRTELNNETHDV